MFPYFPQPSQSLCEKDEGLEPYSTVLVDDGETDKLLLGGVINRKFVGSEGLIDASQGLFRQMLLQILFVDYQQFELGVSGYFAEMAYPELGEEGT